MNGQRNLRLFLAALLLPALAGCGTAEFYWQGFTGQLDLFTRARPIADVAETTSDPRLKERLQNVQAIRRYASRELALPDNGSYTRYADLGRPFVVWNVFAAPELALTPRQWCFPVAGCVNYRGYFAEADARAEAARLAAAGDDVHVGGVPAYSTLGYFDDPVLSTFVRWPEVEVARMVFHELAHQVVYVKDDTQFNESFAAAVEEAGVTRWLAAQRNPALDAHYARNEHLRRVFRDLIGDARAHLGAVYASDAPEDRKRAEKAAALAAMKAAYERSKAGEPGFAGYDRWFAGHDGRGPNNASVASVALYTAQVPAFRALLAEEGGDLARFYARVRAVAALPKAERDVLLAQAASHGPRQAASR